MLGYSFVSGFLRLLLRVWTFGLFYFLDNRLFLWIKDIATPRLSYKKIPPYCEERSSKDHHNRMDSRICLLNASPNPWNYLILSSLQSSKKLPYIWKAKMAMTPSQPTRQSFLFKSSKADCGPQEYWNLHSVSEAAEMLDKNLKSDAMFKNNYSLIPREVVPSCFETNKQDMGLAEQCIFKDFYQNLLRKDVEKMDLLKPDDSALAVCEKHCHSVASIDSGYQSFPSVESAYTCIEEEGITLYVSKCQYDKDGKLICMNVGFGINEDSTTSSDLIFDGRLSDDTDQDSDCESTDDLEEDFIVFDADSACDDADTCSFGEFVFEGTADEISVAMSMNSCCHPTLEIRITQTLPDPHFCSCDEEDGGVVQEQEQFHNKNDKITKTKTDNSSNSAGVVPKKKKVQFQVDKTEVHEMIAWDYAYRQARIGHWKNYAIDRMQFHRRIDHTAEILEPVLQKKISQMKI